MSVLKRISEYPSKIEVADGVDEMAKDALEKLLD
jgi:hypothetical protein